MKFCQVHPDCQLVMAKRWTKLGFGWTRACGRCEAEALHASSTTEDRS